jgi:hypothetical protein
MCKFILNEEELCIVNTKTGKLIRPACINDLIAMHSYFMGRGMEKQAEQMLHDVAKQGKKYISNMVATMQGGYK